jgi:DNA primase large subunit
MRPDPLYARYPFFDAARETVRAADISPRRLVTEDDPAVDRARERVDRALMSGTVESETPDRWSDRDELLSYPIARILVSLVDVRAAVEKYAEAEAATAFDRLTEDFDAANADLRSVSTPRVDLPTVLNEFDLDDAVTRLTDGPPSDRDRFRIDVTAYLRLANPDWGADWRLVNRDLADGNLSLDRDELDRLLREAVRRRVMEGLPFQVRGSTGGDAIASAFDDDVTALHERLSERERLPRVQVVAPDQFPPCMRSILDGNEGGDLPPHTAFAATAFLVSLGLDADAIAGRWPVLDDGTLSYRVTVLDDGGTSQYPVPSCTTMQAFGDCVDPDERCETIDNPLRYYAGALADADADADTSDSRGEAGD